jgi:flagellar protein FliO/FliZ
MFELFGAEMPLAVRFFLAFLIVLGLIGVTAWAVRRFGNARLGGAVRGRQPRLAVIDYASVDGRRRLILVRRDNVEHLLMIGGPTDVVVEPNIVRATPAAAREVPLARPPTVGETLPRVIPLPETAANGSWPLQPDSSAPLPRRMPRAEPTHEEPRGFAVPPPPPVEPASRPQREALAALAEDLAANPVPPPPPPPRARPTGAARPQAVEPRAEARPEPRVPTPPAAPAAPADAEPPAVDQNLAEMAQRLEAALRKPKPAEPHDAQTSPTAAQSAPGSEPAAEGEAAAEPPPPPPPPPPSPPPIAPARVAARPADTRFARPAAKPREGKAIYDTLEQEMASLLGRPPGKTN